jgi:fucose permease
VTPSPPGRRLPAAIVGCLTLLAFGWSGLLIPSLIRSIKTTFVVDDAGIGLVYLAYALAYAAGSFGGGPATERLGRPAILGGGALVHALGVASLGLAPDFAWFIAAALLGGLGAGCLDGGANGLVLDLYREGRGRAMNLLHLFFSLGALSAPLLVGLAVDGGVPWQTVVIASGAAIGLLAIAYLVVPMPSGRRAGSPRASTTSTTTATIDASGPLLSGPLLLLGLAIATYVASEVGVSNWLVRFLEPAPLTTATLALSLYWAGIAVGRLVSSAIADRFDHRRFTLACALAMAGMIAAAILVGSLPLSIALFALAGVASGPIFPMIVALGGERYPERSAAVGGSLTGMAIVGSTLYPPAMGFLSVSVGLTAAMLGNVILALACAAALAALGAARPPSKAGAARRADPDGSAR